MSVLVKSRICHIAPWLSILFHTSAWGLEMSSSSVLFYVRDTKFIDPGPAKLSKDSSQEKHSKKASTYKALRETACSGKAKTLIPTNTSLLCSNCESENSWQLSAAATIPLKETNLVAEKIAPGRRTVLILTAPTNPVTDDAADTFDWTYSPGFELPEFYEYTVDGGTLYQPVTAKPQPVGNNAYSVGQVGVRVKASAKNQQSATLFNDVAFLVAPENLLPHSDFSFGFPFYLYNCSTESAKNIASPVKDPGTYFKSSANGSQTEIRVFQYPNLDNEAVTYSMYVKPVTIDTLTLKVHSSVGGPMSEITFKLSTRAVVSYLNGNGSITAVAGQSGWFKVAFTYVSSTKTSGILRILFPETTSNLQSVFYLAGAQLNRGVTSGTFVAK